MRKIIFILILLLAITLGIGGYFMFFGKLNILNKQHNTEPTTPIAPVITYETQKIEIEKNNNKNIELYNSAIQDQNPTLCESITEDTKKIECQNTIIATTAKKTGSIETCDTISDTGTIILCKDSINADQAISTKNKSLCEKISDPERKIWCQEGIDTILLKGYIESHTVTDEKCRELSTKFLDSCLGEITQIDENSIYNEAIKKNDLELCNNITNAEIKITCLDTIYLKMAVTKQDNELCKELQNQDKKLYCTNQLSKTQDITQYKLAISNNNIDYCESIVTENLKNKCHDTIIISTVKSTKDTTLCDMLTSTGIINRCKQIGQ